MNFKKGIKEIIGLDSKNFSNEHDYFLFALKEIEKHLPELKELEKTKDQHLIKEIIDVYVWSRILVETHNIDESMIKERIFKFKDKIKKI